MITSIYIKSDKIVTSNKYITLGTYDLFPNGALLVGPVRKDTADRKEKNVIDISSSISMKCVLDPSVNPEVFRKNLLKALASRL